MIIVLGATGHIGSAVAEALLKSGQTICIVTRSEERAERWLARGAKAALVDVSDQDALRAVFQQGRRAFLLNPPAAPSTDTDIEEHRTMTGIVAALKGSRLDKIVLESTYGAQRGERIGDLSVLYDFEMALAEQPIPSTVLRAAYYMTNWNPLLAAARGGVLPTMLPRDLKLPMVAPADIARTAARLLTEPADRTGVHYVEGPERYSPNDVAQAFSAALGLPVAVAETPRDEWEDAFGKLGFSAPAAQSYARMTALTVDGSWEPPERPERGNVTLEAHVMSLVEFANATCDPGIGTEV